MKAPNRPGLLSPLLSMWALFAAVLLMMTGNGLQGTLLGVRSSRENFDTAVIGVIQAAYFAGFLVGSRFTIRALARVGHVRVFSALASSASSAVLVHSLFVNEVTWIAMRFVTGFCMAGLYVVVESWLGDQSTPENRGRMLSLYMIVTMGGLTAGQFLLNAADPGSFELFLVASALVSMSLVPIALSATSHPPSVESGHMPLRELLNIVPTGVVTMFFVGAGAGALFSIGPVYADRIGMTTGQISLFVAAAMIGAVIFQMPIGALSDQFSRRGVMFVVAALATAGAVWGAFTGTGFDSTLMMFVLGATSFPLYSLAIAYTNDWIENHQRVPASGQLVLINGVGAIFGPLVASLFMRTFDSSAYWWTLVGAHAAIAAYVLYRIIVRDPVPEEQVTPYHPIPARSSVVVAAIGRIKRPGHKTR